MDSRVMPLSTTVDSPVATTGRPVAWWALASSALLPTMLITAWAIAGARQAATYSPMRQTVSVLSGDAATDRWIVTGALYAVGVAYVVTALGLRALAPAARTGLVVAGLAAIGLASFPQPVHGTSQAHVVCTALGAVTIAVWPALAARQESVLSAVGARRTVAASLVSVVLFMWMAFETRNGPVLGLAERTSSALQSCWPLVVALALRRAHRTSPVDR